MSHGTGRYNKLTGHYKEELFSSLSGTVLEIGAGTGANLPYYPDDINLIVLEPNPFMQAYLREKTEKLHKDMEIKTGVAEEIPYPDHTFDYVVSTLVLCSVDDLTSTLSEIKRVLKPGGTFYFIEHVAAPDNTLLRTIQNAIAPGWRYLAEGCHPNRETGKELQKAGFDHLEMNHTRLPLPVVGPHIIGSAAKAPSH